jgi:rhodanese-related sulfurtransferase
LSFATHPTDLEVDIEQAEQDISAGAALLIDVREEWEFRRRRVPGATLIPLGQLTLRVDELPRDRRILIICEHGNRSLSAAEYLRRRGLDAVSIRGGTSAWARANLPVEQG